MGRSPNWALHWHWYNQPFSISYTDCFSFCKQKNEFWVQKHPFPSPLVWCFKSCYLKGFSCSIFHSILCVLILWVLVRLFSYLSILLCTLVDVAEAGISKVREAWESQRKAYTSEFFELAPCLVSPLLSLSSLSLEV